VTATVKAIDNLAGAARASSVAIFQKSPLPGVTLLGPAVLWWMDALLRQ
jgi:hypothetical protein